MGSGVHLHPLEIAGGCISLPPCEAAANTLATWAISHSNDWFVSDAAIVPFPAFRVAIGKRKCASSTVIVCRPVNPILCLPHPNEEIAVINGVGMFIQKNP